MKKIAWTLGSLAVLAAMPLIVTAADEKKTLSGEIIDASCYLGGKSGEGHAGCAETCIKGGAPAVLVVPDGDKKVAYLALGANKKKIADICAGKYGKQLKVTGKVTEKDGLKVIEIESVE